MHGQLDRASSVNTLYFKSSMMSARFRGQFLGLGPPGGGSKVRGGDLSRGESWSCTKYSNLKSHVSAFRTRVQRQTGVWRRVNFQSVGPCAVLAMKAHVSRLGRDV